MVRSNVGDLVPVEDGATAPPYEIVEKSTPFKLLTALALDIVQFLI